MKINETSREQLRVLLITSQGIYNLKRNDKSIFSKISFGKKYNLPKTELCENQTVSIPFHEALKEKGIDKKDI